MSSDEWMKVTIVIYRDGLFTVMCEGDDTDCKVVSYAVKMTLEMIGYIAKTLMKALLEEVSKEISKRSKTDNGMM
jgi:hypothetical protein